MKKGKVHIIFGTGMGKTAMALGRGVSAAMHGRKVIMIQFLKGVLSHETADGLKQLEPAFKVFRFEKQNEYYENLSEEGKKEELCNIQNGYNFAKKVLCTGECDMLILDEFLGVLESETGRRRCSGNTAGSARGECRSDSDRKSMSGWGQGACRRGDAPGMPEAVKRSCRYCSRVGTFGTESAVRKHGGSRNLPYLNAKPRQIPLLGTYA